MDRTADKPTSLRTPWREARKRAGSFDELRPCLHAGQIPARHGGLFTLSDGKPHSGPGILRPEMWAVVHEDRAGRRVIFFTEEVVFGRVVQEQVFAYDRSIELDSVAFDARFPVAGPPPAEHQEPRRRAVEVDAAAPGQAHPGPAAPAPAPPSLQVEPEPLPGTPARRGPPARYDWDEGIQFMRQKLNTQGDPANPINAVEGWRSDADVARLVAAHIAIGDRQPDLKHTARTIRRALEKWRAEQAERN